VPALTNYDVAYRQELGARVEYEYWLLDYFRTRFFDQTEQPNGVTTFSLEKRTPSGELRAHVEMNIVISRSEPAVKEALARFQLLALTSAFKLQDMIAEWILEANGESNWRFVEKLRSYDRLRVNASLHEPPEFVSQAKVSRAFWELYRAMEPPRGAVIHTGNVTAHASGELEIQDRHGAIHRFDKAFQSAYVRACCLLAASLSGRHELNAFDRAALDNDLATLSTVHRIPGFAAKPLRFDHLRVVVPARFAMTTAPYTCEVNLAELRAWMQQSHPVGAGGELYLSMEVVAQADGRTLVWNLPPELLSADRLVLSENDAALGRYLEIRAL
jgi:hypothetical protein